MPSFAFTARDAAGRWHNGTQAADTTSALSSLIRARGWSLVKAEMTADVDPAAKKSRRFGIRPATTFDVEMGMRMLTNMLDGGLALMAALKTCAEQARMPRMANIWDDVHDRIAGGSSFGDSLSLRVCSRPSGGCRISGNFLLSGR